MLSATAHHARSGHVDSSSAAGRCSHLSEGERQVYVHRWPQACCKENAGGPLTLDSRRQHSVACTECRRQQPDRCGSSGGAPPARIIWDGGCASAPLALGTRPLVGSRASRAPLRASRPRTSVLGLYVCITAGRTRSCRRYVTDRWRGHGTWVGRA